MRIDIQSLGFSLTASLLDHIERRLLFALARISDRIKRVVVRLGDTSGPRGGREKFCRMQVYLKHAPPVLIEDAGVDLYAAIDRVAERARRNVVKRIDRVHEHVPPLASPSGETFDVFQPSSCATAPGDWFRYSH